MRSLFDADRPRSCIELEQPWPTRCRPLVVPCRLTGTAVPLPSGRTARAQRAFRPRAHHGPVRLEARSLFRVRKRAPPPRNAFAPVLLPRAHRSKPVPFQSLVKDPDSALAYLFRAPSAVVFVNCSTASVALDHFRRRLATPSAVARGTCNLTCATHDCQRSSTHVPFGYQGRVGFPDATRRILRITSHDPRWRIARLVARCSLPMHGRDRSSHLGAPSSPRRASRPLSRREALDVTT